MQVLNNPHPKSAFEEQTGIPLGKQRNPPMFLPHSTSVYDAEGWAFKHNGDVFVFYRVQKGDLIPFRKGDFNRWHDAATSADTISFHKYMDTYFPNWSNV